mgnify:CR=1 FL=1
MAIGGDVAGSTERQKIMACLMNYTVQCTDVTSGEKGCFLFDVLHWQKTGEFKAVSPVMPDLEAFFAYDNANGRKRESIYAERESY